MRKFVLVGLFVAALGTPALAADLGGDNYRGSLKDDVPFVRPFNWTGFYVGANAGYGWGNGNSDVTPNLSAFPITLTCPPISVGSPRLYCGVVAQSLWRHGPAAQGFASTRNGD